MQNNQGSKKNSNPAQNLDDAARRKGGENSPQNFKNLKNEDPEKLKQIAKKGGEG